MSLQRIITLYWHRIPLIARLVGALLLFVMLVATVPTLLLVQEAKSFAQARLAEELSVVQAIVPAELLEELPRGNHEAVAQFLQRQVDVRPDLVELSWRATDGRSITALDHSPSAAHVPAWFVARMGVVVPPTVIPLQAGGTDYGTLTIRFDPAHALAPAWQQILTQLKAVAAVLLFIALLSWLVLRSTLRGLRELRAAAQVFESGDFAVRAPLYGAPELRAATTAFNTMVDRIAQLVRTVQTEKEQAEVTLASIGDAVITTDAEGRVSFLNAVAVRLTGWTLEEAAGKPLAEIFHIVNEATRMRVENPVELVLRHGKTVNLANHTVLISRGGEEYCIEDSAAPIRLPDGALLGCVLVFHDVTDNKKLLSAVQWQAGHDALTGLPNRALLTDRFERALASARRQHKLLGVCLLDLDGFKPVNDRYGHEVGDRLLVEVAHRMQVNLRGEDSVARLGGDEFVLLLGDAQNVEEIYAAAQRIIDAIAQPCCQEIGVAISVSASVGLTVYPFDDADSDTLLRHADQAMYQAKQLGRSRFHLFNVSEDRETQAAHRSLLRLREAALPAQGESAQWQRDRNGSLVALAASAGRADPAAGFSAVGRTVRPHRGHWRMGDRAGTATDGTVAGGGPGVAGEREYRRAPFPARGFCGAPGADSGAPSDVVARAAGDRDSGIGGDR
ncbi:MAG: hypothetical protein Fur0026_05130 [Sideroxydans sp.]